MVPQALQIGKNASLGHLALEATQGGFDPFVFADGDLGHETLWRRQQFLTLATDPQRISGGGEGRTELFERPAAGTAPEPCPAELLAEAGATAPEGKGVAGGVEREDDAGVAEGVDPVGWAAGQLSR